MKTDINDNVIDLTPESDVDKRVLKMLRNQIICRVRFENDISYEGKLIIEFDDGWGK